jgi:rubrerythrin
LRSETNQKDLLYPEYIKDAQTEGITDALKAFTFAEGAETEHANMLQTAMDKLEDWRGEKMEFYVCPLCGWTAKSNSTVERCPVCMTPQNKFLRIE